ncbi:hypothetical protein [Natrinema zhouii]|nr:hypothetical protein [Natrinema zhouii]
MVFVTRLERFKSQLADDESNLFVPFVAYRYAIERFNWYTLE